LYQGPASCCDRRAWPVECRMHLLRIRALKIDALCPTATAALRPNRIGVAA
jgi:hypothetical protein